MRMVAVVLAGGSGQRFGAVVPKQLLELDGRTLLEHCVGAFDAAPGVDEVLIVMPPGRTADAEKLRADGAYPKVSGVIEGGTSRPGSTRAAITAIRARHQAAGDDSDWSVLFHDAARPLVDQRIIADCVAALEKENVDALGVAVPTADPPPRQLAPLPDSAGLRAVGDQPGPRAGPGRPGLRAHRRLRCGAALPARRPGARGPGQRAQHEDHLPARPDRGPGPDERGAGPAMTASWSSEQLKRIDESD